MKGEFISIGTLEKMASYEKKQKMLNEKIEKQINVLEVIECYLTARINKLKKCESDKYDIAILELTKLENEIISSKENIKNKDDHNENL